MTTRGGSSILVIPNPVLNLIQDCFGISALNLGNIGFKIALPLFFRSHRFLKKEEVSMSEVTLLVRAGQLVTAHDQPSIPNGAVALSGNRIEAVGRHDELSKRFPDVRTIGGEQFLLIPGLINGHSHGKGLSDFQRGARDNTLESWILDMRKYLPLSTYDDIAFSAARLLKSGVTTTMHNHVLKDPANYSQEFREAIEAFKDAGIRVQFDPGVRNANPFIYGDNKAFLETLPEKVKKTLAAPPAPGSLTGDNFVEAVTDLHARHHSPMCRIGFGPMAPQWCTQELLMGVKRAAEKLRTVIHVHAVQTLFRKICFPFVDSGHDPIEVLLFRGKGSHVHTVIVDGRIVVENGKLQPLDEEVAGKRLAEEASRPRTEKEKELLEVLDELKRHVIRYYQGWTKKAETKPYFAINSRQ
jgi:cytosine/adenosine deaminase-related metal-dependent hydrolase